MTRYELQRLREFADECYRNSNVPVWVFDRLSCLLTKFEPAKPWWKFWSKQMNKIYVGDGALGLDYLTVWYVDQVEEPHKGKRAYLGMVASCKFLKCIYVGSAVKAETLTRQQDKVFSIRVSNLADTFEDVVRLVRIQLERFKKEHENGTIVSEAYVVRSLQAVEDAREGVLYHKNYIERLERLLGKA